MKKGNVMKYMTGIAITLSLLGSCSTFADTRTQQVTKVFDASYRALFPKTGNIIELKKNYAQPLKVAISDIKTHAHSISNKFDGAVNDLSNATDAIIAIPTQIYNQYSKDTELVMLTFQEWTAINASAKNNLDIALASISSAFKKIDDMRSAKQDERDIIELLNHIVKRLQKAVSRIQLDLLKAINDAKDQIFSSEQAAEKGTVLTAISGNNIPDKRKWEAIMDLIGLDKEINPKNLNLAYKKFGIDPTKPIGAGVSFKNKGEVKIAINTLYSRLTGDSSKAAVPAISQYYEIVKAGDINGLRALLPELIKTRAIDTPDEKGITALSSAILLYKNAYDRKDESLAKNALAIINELVANKASLIQKDRTGNRPLDYAGNQWNNLAKGITAQGKCPVCLEKTPLATLTCGHRVCQECLDKIMRKPAALRICPICGLPITN